MLAIMKICNFVAPKQSNYFNKSKTTQNTNSHFERLLLSFRPGLHRGCATSISFVKFTRLRHCLRGGQKKRSTKVAYQLVFFGCCDFILSYQKP